MTSRATHSPTRDVAPSGDGSHSAERAAAVVAVAFGDGTGRLTHAASGEQELVSAGSLVAACGQLLAQVRALAATQGRPVDVELRTPGLQPWRVLLDQDGLTTAHEPASLSSTASSTAPALVLSPVRTARQAAEPRRAVLAPVGGHRLKPAVVATIAGLAVIALGSLLLLRGHVGAAPTPTRSTEVTSPTSVDLPTASATTPAPSATSSTSAGPVSVRVRATTPAGGPLGLVISTAPTTSDRILHVTLRGGHGRVISAKSIALAANRGTVRAAFHAANVGAYAWQITGPGLQTATGTATVPPQPSTPTSAASTHRPPTQAQTASSSGGSAGGTKSHRTPSHSTHHASKKPRPKISISVPPSPLDRPAPGSALALGRGE